MINRREILKWLKENEWFLGPWETKVMMTAISEQWDYKLKKRLSGFVDAHIHLDRVMTFKNKFFPSGINLNEIADLPLKSKQDLIGFLHEGEAYTEKSLRERMGYQIERAIKAGTRQMWAVVDTTPDIGLRAFDIAKNLQKTYQGKIDLKVACYPLFGFKDILNDSERYKILESAMPRADFIVGLPEKDDDPKKVGFKGHVNLLLTMACKHKKSIQIHVDQKNSAYQNDSFRVIECLEGLTPKKLSWICSEGRPKLWLVHVISPSCYSGKKFSKLLDMLLKYNIGVICCPTAGISMRQLRSEKAPIHNCLARVIEMLKMGVTVEIGTDNVNDYLVPSGSGLILREIAELSNIVRNYATHVLVKVGMGISLNNGDRTILGRALYTANKAYTNHHGETLAIQNNISKTYFEY